LFAVLLFTLHCTGIVLQADELPTVVFDYYGEIGCSHCDLFAEKVLPLAEETAGIKTSANYYDILSREGFERCEQELSQRGYTFSVFPVLVIGNNVYQGNSAVEKNLPEELSYFAEYGLYRPRVPEKEAPRASTPVNLAFVPVFLAGLVDGVNPCAFATMLFFISWITLRGGGRRRVLCSGGAFICGIFLAYLGIGFGLLTFMRGASAFEFLRLTVRYLFTGMALLFALFSFKDALWAGRGQEEKMLLQLPKNLKKRIHAVIRENTSGQGSLPFLMLISFALSGFIVALLELACTGQIYLPTIAYMLQSGAGKDAGLQLVWLLVYNLAFILPLTGILVLALAGVEQQTVRNWFSKNIAAGKTAMGLLFVLLALLIWFSGA